MTKCEVREIVHLVGGLSLLKRGIGLLQTGARRLYVRACGLLRQWFLGKLLYFAPRFLH
jgi:hypothetical protein